MEHMLQKPMDVGLLGHTTVRCETYHSANYFFETQPIHIRQNFMARPENAEALTLFCRVLQMGGMARVNFD